MNYLRDTNEDSSTYRQRLIKHYSSLETLEEMRWCLAREWIARYQKKMKEVGKVKATTWWHSQADTMEAKHGLTFITDLKRRMNDIRKNG